MTTKEQETNRAKEQARAQLESIVAMVKRLEHCRECDGKDCELSDKDILEGQNLYWREGVTATDADREAYHDEDAARDAICEDPLSVLVRSGWTEAGESMQAEEYEILLCTGGPAVRIVGDLNHGSPETARIEYQDWFTPWETLHGLTDYEQAQLLAYAGEFCFEC
jgi:hypothetical protein